MYFREYEFVKSLILLQPYKLFISIVPGAHSRHCILYVFLWFGNKTCSRCSVLCAPCGLSLLYWTRKKNVEAMRESSWTFIKWPTRLQTTQPQAQKHRELLDVNPADVLTADLLLIMQLCPGLDLAAPPHSSPEPWMNQHQHKMLPLLSPHWNIHQLLGGNCQLAFGFIQVLCFNWARQKT